MSFFTQIEDIEELRQGDIIRRLNTTTGETEELGVIITADCDIAQKKAGGRYTWLEIIPMKTYIEGLWAEDQLKKLSEKRSKGICEQLNSQIRKRKPDLFELTHQSLSYWLLSRTAEEIITIATSKAPAANEKLLRDLQAFAIAVTPSEKENSLFRLKRAWNLFGFDERAQKESMRNAFKENGGFQDYFVLPELPMQSNYGFVVMLRSMWTIMAYDIYPTEQDARIHNQPNAFHRIGRLNDDIRFSITQKLAFLFSRIGMAETFESACQAATEIAIEEIFKESIKED